MPEVDSSDDAPFVFLSNRGSQLFRNALEPLGGRVYQQGDRHIDLLYFDTYDGKTPPDDVSVGFTLIDRQRTIPLDHKAKMANALIDAGINYPRVYFDAVDVPDEPGSLWFIKNPLSTAGKGIEVVTREQLETHFEFGSIIQEAVQDLALMEGKKFTLRIYALVNQGKLYLYPAGIVVLHGADYEADSVEPIVQFEHSGYMDADSPVKMLLFSEFPVQDAVFGAMRSHLIEIFSAFKNLLKYEKAHTYCLFGVDLLVKKDLTVALIEINDRPNVVHTSLINEEVNTPMIAAMCCVLNPAKDAYRAPQALRFEMLAEL